MSSKLPLALAATLLCTSASAATNLIDQTYGAGAGSFELGVFVPGGSGLGNFQSLLAGAATLTGWQIGGVGVDWLSTPGYASADGLHAVDLGYLEAGAGSVSVTLPTQIGATYALDFKAAAVPGNPAYTNTGTVTAGSLVGAGFTVPFSAPNDFGGQVYVTKSFSFVATGASTVVTIAAAVAGTAYGPVIDQVSVTLLSAVPEPGSLALWMLGGCVLVARRHAARQR
jgi:Protein of unknown function (DUF642)